MSPHQQRAELYGINLRFGRNPVLVLRSTEQKAEQETAEVLGLCPHSCQHSDANSLQREAE